MRGAWRPGTLDGLAPGAHVADELLITAARSSPPTPLPTLTSTRRLTSTLTLLALAIALVSALLGPAQTLAQTRTARCPSSTGHVKARRAHACARSTHKGKAHGRKHRSKHALAKEPQQGVPASLPAAYCEDGSSPVQASDGSFSCADGSAPECEDGAEPTRSSNGRSLVCAIPGGEGEEEAESGESECEEAGTSCPQIPAPSSDEHSCEVRAGESSSFLCE